MCSCFVTQSFAFVFCCSGHQHHHLGTLTCQKWTVIYGDRNLQYHDTYRQIEAQYFGQKGCWNFPGGFGWSSCKVSQPTLHWCQDEESMCGCCSHGHIRKYLSYINNGKCAEAYASVVIVIHSYQLSFSLWAYFFLKSSWIAASKSSSASFIGQVGAKTFEWRTVGI